MYVISRLYKKILKAADLEYLRFHDLRHTYVTLALQNGVDVKTLSAILGYFVVTGLLVLFARKMYYNYINLFRLESMAMDYVTPKDKAKEWGLTQRRVEVLCDNGRVSGAYRLGRVWAIPKDAKKPIDGRTKAAKRKKVSI